MPMGKKKIKLATVLQLKDYVQNEIQNIYWSIRQYNESGLKLEPLFDQVEYYESELIKLKELIRDANALKHKDGHTNDYYIYLLSNINNKIYQLNKIKGAENSAMTLKEKNMKVRSLMQEADKIKTKLSSFNESTKVSLDVSDERLAKFI